MNRHAIARSLGFILGAALLLALLPRIGLPSTPIEVQRVEALARSGALGPALNYYLGTTNYVFTPVGRVSTVAGVPGVPGSTDGDGEDASFNTPAAVAVSLAGIAVIADKENHTVRRLRLGDAQVSTIAGAPGQAGFVDGAGEGARFNQPTGVAVDEAGTIALVADSSNHLIRRIDLLENTVTTLAGSPGQAGFADGVGAAARFNNPVGVALSRDGAIALVADTDNHLIRRIDLATGAVTTVAGSPGQSGRSDGVGAAARFNQPASVAYARSGTFAVAADYGTRTIRRIDLATGAVSTVASIGAPLTGATLANGLLIVLGVGLSCDESKIFFADGQLQVVGEVLLSPARPRINFLAGDLGAPGSQDGQGNGALFNRPTGITTSCLSNEALIADSANHLIRELLVPPVYQVALPLLTFPEPAGR